MMQPGKKPKAKFWGGQCNHPFFKLLSDRVDSLGFQWAGVKIDNEVGVAGWRRPLFDGYTLELSLMAENPRHLKDGFFGFEPTLFVVSNRQSEIWNGYRIWECFNLVRGSRVQAEEGPISILVVNLRWLVSAWSPVNGEEVRPMWHRVRLEDAANCADLLTNYLRLHLPRLLPLVSSGQALAHTLLNLEVFPGKADGNGPLSAFRNIFTAILLHDLGRTEEAMKELALEERQDIAAVNRGMDAQYLEVTRCQIARLSRWMQGAKPLPSVSGN